MLNYFRKNVDLIYKILEQAFRANEYGIFVQWFVYVAQNYKVYLKNGIKLNKNQKKCTVFCIVLEKVVNVPCHIISHLFTKLTVEGVA